jgi:hypothetical protein
MCPTCTTSFCCIPWNLVPLLVPLPLNQPVSIGIPYTACHVYAHAPFTHLAVAGPRTRRSLSFADPPASCPGRSFVSIRRFHSPSIQHAHSHSAFGHIAVSLSWAFRYPFICLVSSILLLSHAATYTSLYLQSVHSNHHRSALQKRAAFTAERTSLNLEPPLPYLVVPSAFALWLSFFIPCLGI